MAEWIYLREIVPYFGHRLFALTQALAGQPPPHGDGPRRVLRRRHELPDGIKDDLELGVIFLLEFPQLAGEVLVGCQDFPEPDEGPYDLHAGLFGDSGVQEARKHNCPVLSKCVGKGRRKPERNMKSSGKRSL